MPLLGPSRWWSCCSQVILSCARQVPRSRQAPLSRVVSTLTAVRRMVAPSGMLWLRWSFAPDGALRMARNTFQPPPGETAACFERRHCSDPSPPLWADSLRPSRLQRRSSALQGRTRSSARRRTTPSTASPAMTASSGSVATTRSTAATTTTRSRATALPDRGSSPYYCIPGDPGKDRISGGAATTRSTATAERHDRRRERQRPAPGRCRQ